MIIGDYNIKPIAVHLPDTPEWVERKANADKHFGEAGVEDIYWLAGIHAKKWGIQGRHIYLLDGRPEEQFYVGDGNVGNYLTQYCAYTAMDCMDYSHYLYLEDDCRLVEGWKERLAEDLKDVPPDFDWVFVGSCCAMDKEPVHIKGNVYEFPYRGADKWNWYPMCTHCYIVAKKAVPHLIATNRDVANNTDISIIRYSFPEMKVYGILPRLAGQGAKTKLTE